MSEFSPHLEILPPTQRRLWAELSQLPSDFVLYGGTAGEAGKIKSPDREKGAFNFLHQTRMTRLVRCQHVRLSARRVITSI
jgi:hypothetical protein